MVKQATRRDLRLSHACDCFDRFCGQALPERKTPTDQRPALPLSFQCFRQSDVASPSTHHPGGPRLRQLHEASRPTALRRRGRETQTGSMPASLATARPRADGVDILSVSYRLRVDDYTTPVGGAYVVYPSSRHLSPRVKAFIELAAERWSAAGTSENDEAVVVSNQSR